MPATSAAYKTRPIAVFGVVFGSEIMKNAKISNAPFCIWWNGMLNGSLNHNARPNISAA